MIEPLEPGLAMRELRHRMDNTLQMVSGLIGREARSAEGGAVHALRKAEAQIQAFALLNRVLDDTGAGEFAEPCAAAYHERLCAHLDRACLRPARIGFETSFDAPCPLDERRCRALGLIVTELVLNAVKHAFKDREQAVVGICLGRTRASSSFMLGVMDNGCGFPALPTRVGQGMGFVQMLAESIGAECRVETGLRGTRVAIVAPVAA